MQNFLENRYKYAKLLAIVGMAVEGIFFLLTYVNLPDFIYNVLAVVWIGCTIGAYVCGGLVTAIKMALNIGKWGWLVVPFPIDIATGLGTMFIALVVFFLAPIVPVCKAEKEYMTI